MNDMRNCENPMPEVEKAEKIRPLSLEELELVVGGHVEMDEDDKLELDKPDKGFDLDDRKKDEEDTHKDPDYDLDPSFDSGRVQDPGPGTDTSSDSGSKNVNTGGDARSDIFEQMADMDYACGGSIDIDGWD